MSTPHDDQQQPAGDSPEHPTVQPPAAGDAATAPLPPQAAPSAAAPPSAPAAAAPAGEPAPTPAPAPAPAPARKSFWRRTWVLITAPILAALLVLLAGVGIGWAASSADHGGRGGVSNEHGGPGQDQDNRGSHDSKSWRDSGSTGGSDGSNRMPHNRQGAQQDDPSDPDGTQSPAPTTTPSPTPSRSS